jgi:hypothetical protein
LKDGRIVRRRRPTADDARAVLAFNDTMKQTFVDSGFEVAQTADDGVTELPLTAA